MINSQSVLANFIIKIGSDVYSRVGMLILIILIARIYQVESFGNYALAFALVNMLYIASELGLHVLFIRDAAEDINKSKKYWEKLVSLKILACIFAILVVFIAAYSLSYSKDVFQLLLASTVWMISNSFIDLINSYFTAMEKLKYVLINTLIYRSLLYVSAAFALLTEAPLITICWIQASSSVIGVIGGISILINQIGFFRILIDKGFIIERLKAALPIALSGVMISIYLRADTLLLAKLTNEIQVGLYNAAFKLYETLIFIPTVFQTVIIPKLVVNLNSKEELSHTAIRASKFMILISLPICIAMMAESAWIINLLYGEKYIDASVAMAIISPSVFFLFLYSIPAILLIIQSKQSINALASFWAMIINVGGNYFLIPQYGLIGSAVMVSITQFVMLLILFYYCKSFFFQLDFYILLFKSFLIAMILILFLLYLDLQLKMVEFLLALLVYCCLIVVFKLFSIGDIKELYNVTKNNLNK